MMGSIRAFLEIFGPRKDFGGRGVGNPTLNRLGLHPARIAVCNALLGLRRAQVAALGRPRDLAHLHRDGILVIPDFLPSDLYEQTRAEAHRHLDDLARDTPLPVPEQRGFGARRPFAGGFDRFDGGTLNRYAVIDRASTPACATAIRHPALVRLARAATGFRHRPGRFLLYQTVHGEDENAFPDIQKVLHKDTFHSAIKLWLFLDPVTLADGPLTYVPGSHKMTRERYRWEYERANAAARPDTRDKGGAFRVTAAELERMKMPPPRRYPVAGNTLIIADVRGFHCRSPATPGARRLSLHASLRMWPFSPIPY